MHSFACLVLLLQWSCIVAVAGEEVFGGHAERAFVELQSRYFDGSFGVWHSSLWWQNANTIEAISNLALARPSIRSQVEEAVALVFNNTENSTVGRCNIGVNRTFSGYFDDEAWWGIAWLKAYHLTGRNEYLNRSRAVFDDLVDRSWSEASCGGGFCWQASADPANMNACYKNSITNELGLTLAAQLALTYQSLGWEKDSNYTLHWAERELAWFMGSGLINGSYLINDGLDTFSNHWQVCLNNRHTAYTYNQGVILSGLAYMWKLHRNASSGLLETATRIVESVFSSHLLYKGTHILREMDEVPHIPIENLYSGSPGTDGLQFKSVFLRHLRYLIDVIADDQQADQIVRTAGGSPAKWLTFIRENAESIWFKAACAGDQALSVDASLDVPPLFGYRFVGPCSWVFGGPSATTQSAAIDVFTSAMTTLHEQLIV